ncbi:hypothetical protein ABZ896_01045 [Streptomyces sp. NPDC047072]|uniref:hypothetical protein n=1 Tax=Streptomyces sp. NPDC047072 TaxID=3154809 RepID=UPI0033EA40FB
MSDSDIALLLADATDEVEIGIAPYEAVLRGGRRRRARRWAVAAATTLVLAASSATLAVAGLPGGGDGRGVVATQPPTADATTPTRPAPANRTTLATGTEDGKDWRVTIDLWEAPQDEVTARALIATMREYGENPPDVDRAADLVGKIAYFIHLDYDGKETPVMENTVPESDRLSGKDLVSGTLRLDPAADGPARLLIGRVATTAWQVSCTWTNETAIMLQRDANTSTDTPAIRQVDGSPYAWIVCLAPKGAGVRGAEVVD